MNTPRPSEADVEALAKVLLSADDSVDMRYCVHVAEQVLASDWLAARDAEHEREVAALRESAERIAYEHAATVDGEFGCAHDAEALRAGGRPPAFDGDEFQTLPDDCEGKQVLDRHLHALLSRADGDDSSLRAEVEALAQRWEKTPARHFAAKDLRALLPRDDAAGGA